MFSPSKAIAVREAKNWSQSDVARAIWGPDGRGGARNRALISSWEMGNSLPSKRNLKRLADALGCAPADLLDPAAEPPPGRQSLPFLMTHAPGKPGIALVQINMEMPFSIAAAICERLGEI